MTRHFHEPVTFFLGSVPLRFSYILHLNIPLYSTIYFLCHNLGTIFCYRLLNLSKMPKYNYYDESLSRNRNIFLGECTSEIFLYITPKYTTLLHYILCHNLGTIFCYRLLNLSKMPKYNYYDESLSRNP